MSKMNNAIKKVTMNGPMKDLINKMASLFNTGAFAQI